MKKEESAEKKSQAEADESGDKGYDLSIAVQSRVDVSPPSKIQVLVLS